MGVQVEEQESIYYRYWMGRMVTRLIRRIDRSAQVLLTGKLHEGKRREIPPINLEEVIEAKQFFPMEKFFIFGHARSGTTLLTRLIRLHPEVHCNYQAHFFSRPPLLEGLVADVEIGKWFTRSSNRWNRQRDLSPVVLRTVSDFILERDARREGANIVGDKSPNSLLNGQAVHKLFNIYPDARLIFLVRDGRDAALSHRIQSFVDNPDRLSKDDKEILKSFIKDSEPYVSGKRSLFTRKGITQAANGWVENVVETDKYGRKLYGDRYHSLRFEDLLALPQKEMASVWSFLGVDTDIPELRDRVTDELIHNPDADWQLEKAGQIAQSLNKGKHGSWRDMFTQKDIQIFSQIAGDTLNDWGYEDIMATWGGKEKN
jgi:hypothetical protein